MESLAEYFSERCWPPEEIPGGVRWYTEEEVSAFRCYSTGTRITERQRRLVEKIIAEVNSRTNQGEESPSVIIENFYNAPVYHIGGAFVGLVFALVFVLGWLALGPLAVFFRWLEASSPLSYFGLGAGAVAAGLLYVYTLNLTPGPEDDEWPGII